MEIPKNQEAKRQGAVAVELSRLFASKDNLESAMKDLDTVLSPLMHAPTPIPAPPKPENEGNTCALADQLYDLRRHVDDAITVLRLIMDRLEL